MSGIWQEWEQHCWVCSRRGRERWFPQAKRMPALLWGFFPLCPAEEARWHLGMFIYQKHFYDSSCSSTLKMQNSIYSVVLREVPKIQSNAAPRGHRDLSALSVAEQKIKCLFSHIAVFWSTVWKSWKEMSEAIIYRCYYRISYRLEYNTFL